MIIHPDENGSYQWTVGGGLKYTLNEERYQFVRLNQKTKLILMVVTEVSDDGRRVFLAEYNAPSSKYTGWYAHPDVDYVSAASLPELEEYVPA